MTSENSASGESPDHTLDSFVEKIEELQSPYDVRTVQDIVRDAVLANLRTAEIAYLEEVIQDRTGLKPKTVAAMIKEQFGLGEGADVVLECTGAEPCIQAGINVAKKGGTYVQAGMGKEVRMRF